MGSSGSFKIFEQDEDRKYQISGEPSSIWLRSQMRATCQDFSSSLPVHMLCVPDSRTVDSETESLKRYEKESISSFIYGGYLVIRCDKI